MTALLLLVLLQEDPARLVEGLRSDQVEERQKAETALRKLGEAALPELEKAARDPDLELSSRAATLLRIIALNRELPAQLKAKHPQLAERLAKGEDSLWTDAFLEHVWTWDREGLDFLVARAIRGRKKAENGEALLMHLQRHPLPSAVPELVRIVHQGDAADRKAALGLLRGYGYEWRQSPMDVLAGAAAVESEPPPQVRRAAAACFPEIRAMVEHPLPEVRFLGAMLLGRFGSRESIPALLKLIEKDSVEIRRASVEALIVLKAPEALPFALENLKSPDAGVRARAIEAIERLGAKDRAPGVAGLLSDSSPMVAGQAMVTLARLGASEHRPAISAYVEAPSSAVRYYAVLALGFYGAKDLAGTILTRLNDEDVEVRWASIVVLGALGSREAVPELEKLVKAPLEKTRVLAQKSLDRIGRSPAPPPPPARETLPAALLKAMPGLADESTWVAGFLETSDREKHPTLRAKDVEPLARGALARAGTPVEKGQVCWAIAVWDQAALAPRLVPLLRDTEEAERALRMLDARECARDLLPMLEEIPPARDRAARLLNVLDPARTDPFVVKHLDSPRAPLCVLGIEAAARLGKKEAIPKLLKLLDHEDEEVALKAGVALGQLEAVEAVPRLVRLLGQGKSMAYAILPAIARLDRAEGRKQGERLLAHRDERVRETAMRFLAEELYRESIPEIWKRWDGAEGYDVPDALVRMNAREQIPALLKAMEDPQRLGQVVSALGRMNAREAIPEIRRLLRSDDEEIRYAAANALADLGDRESIPGVEALLDSKDPLTRAVACELLGRLGPTDRLRKLLEDPDEEVVAAAAVALGDRAALSSAFKKADTDRRRNLLPAVLRLSDVETLLTLPEPRGRFLLEYGGTALNAIRRPDAWRRLREARLPRDLEGTGREVLEAVSRQSGFALEMKGDLPRHLYVPSRGGLATLLDALEAVDAAFILEADRIRILPGLEAQRFWRAWWAAEEAKR